MSKDLSWNMYAGGTSAAEGKRSYDAHGWFGQFVINPPSVMRPRSGYSLQWANSKGLLVTHTHMGLWHDVGQGYRSPASAKAAAQAYIDKHLSGFRPKRSR